MKNILWLEEINYNHISLVGGKNASLGEMYGALSKKGVNVPNGFAFTTKAYWDFMKKLRKISCHSGRRVLVLADNARYHHATLHAEWREDCSKRFAQLFLPPYSPELNPIERVWKLTRRLATHNRYFEKIDMVAESVEAVFDSWSKPNPTLKKLCAIIYQLFTDLFF